MSGRLQLSIAEIGGQDRSREVVTIGVPLPRSMAGSADDLTVEDGEGGRLPWQGLVLARWPDRSVKWLLISIMVSVRAGSRLPLYVTTRSPAFLSAPARIDELELIHAEQRDNSVLITTGARRFVCDASSASMLSAVFLDGTPLLGTDGVGLRLCAPSGRALKTVVDTVRLGPNGPVRAQVVMEGHFLGDKACPLEFCATLTFLAGNGVVDCEVLVRNPRPALHRGGLWDLGDAGSWELGDLSIQVCPGFVAREVSWHTHGQSGSSGNGAPNCTIYQDSSGGDRWDSPNHVCRDGRLGVSFRGFEVRRTQETGPIVLERGLRAQPVLQVQGDTGVIGMYIPNFWQEFPKALRWCGQSMTAGLYPRESRAHHELQGGEQKRHRVLIDFGSLASPERLFAAAMPLQVSVDPLWIEHTGAIPGFVVDLGASLKRDTWVQQIVTGPNSFAARREMIDEYGWRNFGDIYADHEAIRHTGEQPFISHYNNQYDFVYGAAIQALRTSDPGWWRLMDDGARHVADIDVYHTQGDRAAFNGGMFWHTDHHVPAATATHRSYSRGNQAAGDYGGGPGPEHNYASGLLLHHYLTGDSTSADVVRELADWVIAMDDGNRTWLGLADPGATGLASRTVENNYHGPGRGAGNSISTLVDAYLLTGQRLYLTHAEALIARCIHPRDDIAGRKLDEPEYRWSYLVFLQFLGKYLDLKLELGEIDFHFQYARESLLHYANWMLEHEVPYIEILDRVKLPTETWPAQDIRKVHVFHLAACYAGDLREQSFRKQAIRFHERCIEGLESFESRTLARPLILLCVFGHQHDYHLQKLGAGWNTARSAAMFTHGYTFGEPQRFLPQSARAASVLKTRLCGAWMDVCRRIHSTRWSMLWRNRYPGRS